MKFPHVTPKMAIGGVLGVIAVAIGIQVYRTHDESSAPSGRGMRTENGRGQYGHGRKRRHDDDGDEGGDDDHHEKKHKKHKHKHR